MSIEDDGLIIWHSGNFREGYYEKGCFIYCNEPRRVYCRQQRKSGLAEWAWQRGRKRGYLFRFIRDVDTVIMGWNTYYQVTTELSPDEWVYKGLTTYVITHRKFSPTEDIKFVQDNPCSVVEQLKSEEGKAIWICGGASIIQPLMQGGLIDEFYISIMPTILGSGIRLFEESQDEIKLKLVHTQSYNGITELAYARR